MNKINQLLIGLIIAFFTASLGLGGYLMKYMLDKIDIVNSAVYNIKPKVDTLWEQFIINKNGL